jgi:predicted nucleic acid-binding protein
MSYLFDTNAISEAMRPRPNADFVSWLCSLPREEQFTSILVIAELYVGAFRSQASQKWLERIEQDVLPSLTVLDFDLECARRYGELRADLEQRGTPIGETDCQIAATALRYKLVVVTANTKHFQRVEGLDIRPFTPGTKGIM